ncbi:MAG: 5-formyltetrahydrofolate cyclo-ligase [Halodesulfurarchaeum sp.]
MAKEPIRQRVWDAMEEEGIARFPFPPHDRIPNFDGAERAADRLSTVREWTSASVIKANPDAPQLPVRRAALHAGKTVFMAVPRLRSDACFMRLDPADLDDPDRAATLSHASEYATRVRPAAVPEIDMVVAGSVSVTESGDWIGKGEGYSDLEFAILEESGSVTRETVVATTVHEIQVTGETFPVDAHDVPMDLIVTPERTIRTDRLDDRPSEIDWTLVSENQLDDIPVLRTFADRS